MHYIYNIYFYKNKTMKIGEYLKQPATIRKIVVFIFVLWATWSSLNFQIQENHRSIHEFEEMKIDVTIMQMQTDIAWIRQALEKK